MKQGRLGRSRNALALALVAGLAAPGAAEATFPGAPGQILYTCSSSTDESARTRVCVVGADGSGNRRVVEGGDMATWSPDGVHFAYMKEAASESPGGNPEFRIHLTRIDGGSATRRLETEDGASTPAWAPDGTRLAFAGGGREGSSDSDDIWVIDLDNRVRNVSAGVPGVDVEPDWSPDGRRIAFTSNREDGRQEIYTADVDSGAITRVTRSPGGGSSSSPSWSPDGSKIAFVREQTGEDPLPEGTAHDLYVVNADGSGERALTNHFAAGERNVKVHEPAWSPDGTRLVFSYDSESEDDSLRLIGADGAGETPLGVTGHTPDWGPVPGSNPAQPLPVPRASRVKLTPRAIWSAPADITRPSSRDGATLRFRMSSAGYVAIGAQRMRGRRPRGKATTIATVRARAGSNRFRWLGVYGNGNDVPRGTFRLVLIPLNGLADTGRTVYSPKFRMLGNCLDRKRKPCRVRR